MKKIFTLLVAALAMTAAKAQDVTVTFEDAEGSTYWSLLIDNPQYGGTLIYSSTEYTWTDATTQLSSNIVKDDWSIYGSGYEGKYGPNHGIAISNYVDASTTATYTEQLSVPVAPTVGKKFAVVWDNNSELSFADGQAHVIKSMDVINTTYALNNINKAKGDGYFFQASAAFTFEDNTTSAYDIVLASGTSVIDTWKTIDFSNFVTKPVKKIVFTFSGSDTNDWGLVTPKYFAFDNVVVDMTPTAVETIMASATQAYPVAYFTLDGKQLAAPQKGLNIVKMSDGSSKKIMR